jgi:hypothetical protein
MKRVVMVPFILACVLFLYSPGWSAVVGTWDIQGPMTMKITAKGQKTTIIKGTMDDIWTFHEDGTFESQDAGGAWTEPTKKFTVYPDPTDISDIFEEMLSEELETDITVEEITEITCIGAEKKDGTIKGKLKISMNIYSSEYGIYGKAKISCKFVGIPADVMN